MSRQILFLRKQEVIDIHARLLIAFGGSEGLRDEGALESALGAAEQRAYYEDADIVVCAATYAYHLTQAHAFVDGNKRIAAAVTEIFAEFNGATFQASDDEIIELFLNIAEGKLSRLEVERILTKWIVV